MKVQGGYIAEGDGTKPPLPTTGSGVKSETNALTERRVAALVAAAKPFAEHDWMDAELEDDNCKLARGSGPITVGHWRALRAALAALTMQQGPER